MKVNEGKVNQRKEQRLLTGLEETQFEQRVSNPGEKNTMRLVKGFRVFSKEICSIILTLFKYIDSEQQAGIF